MELRHIPRTKPCPHGGRMRCLLRTSAEGEYGDGRRQPGGCGAAVAVGAGWTAAASVITKLRGSTTSGCDGRGLALGLHSEAHSQLPPPPPPPSGHDTKPERTASPPAHSRSCIVVGNANAGWRAQTSLSSSGRGGTEQHREGRE